MIQHTLTIVLDIAVDDMMSSFFEKRFIIFNTLHYLICHRQAEADKIKAEKKVATPRPAKSALNSSMDEMKKVVKSGKHEKVKNGKSLELEKNKEKKAADVAKKHDSVKKEKKFEGGKPSKKTVDSDDDQPLVRTDFCIFRFY